MFKKISKATVIIWIVGWLIAYLVLLPPINPGSLAFWIFFTPALIIPLLIFVQSKALKDGVNKGKSLWPIFIFLVAVAIFFGGMFIVSPTFNARGFANRIIITESSFEEDIKPVDFNNLPLLDKASSQKVGDRVVGQIPELVSQFTVSDEYSLINYKNQIVRVTPLEHMDFYKYIGNHNGTAGYVVVDCTTGEAQLVRTTEGLKYLDSSYLFHNLKWHVQICNPFSILGETSFELDDEGNPYWVIQTLKYSWVNIKPQVSGIIVCDAITGKMQRYKVGEVPSWIDNVYDAKLVTEEINSWGMYKNGYINSQYQQKDVVQATDGYTYITRDDDVYMYTGITSIATDESNIGFVMVNLRTHEARYYPVPGAEEYSAMDSAKGVVQEKNYTSTFPLLINLNNRPTYLLSLKDSAGLVKMYAFVDVENYQKVTVTDAAYGIKVAAEQYLKMMDSSTDPSKPDETIPKEFLTDIITIKKINQIMVEGNTIYYITSDTGLRFELPVTVDLSIVPFITEGDTIKVEYYNTNNLNKVVSVEIVSPEVPETPTETVPTAETESGGSQEIHS